MNLCSDGHDEVCFDQRECPCCQILGDLKDEITDLTKSLKDAETRADDAENALDAYEDDVVEQVRLRIKAHETVDAEVTRSN